jgi:hypothetical protein
MEQTTIRLARRLALALAVLWVVAGAASAAAQVDPDEDGDGVVDTLDECNDTPEGDLIDAQGCSVCPCDATAAGDPWASHDAYVACVMDEAKARREAKTMKRREMRNVIRRARKATCGDQALTRCCVYAHLDDTADVSVGQCRIMTVDACEEMGLREDLDWVEDVEGGSCTPNPCLF